MKLVTILVPAFNEQDSLPCLHKALCDVLNTITNYDFEILFINDGSRDNTLNVIKQLRQIDNRISYVDLSRNFGKENAMLAGFDYAKGDAIIIMDADLQHPPHIIPEFIEKWEQGYDDVYAARKSRGNESWLRKKLTMTYYNILKNSSRIDVLPNVGDFRLLDRKCIDTLKQMREYGRYTKGMYCYIGYKKIGVEFETQDRVAGESSMSYRNLIKLALEGIMSYTIAPLRLATYMGLAVALVTFISLTVFFIKTLIFGDPVAGFPTLIVTILFLGGVQLVAVGIIGEYLGRVYEEVKHRPVYIAREYNDKFVKIDK